MKKITFILAVFFFANSYAQNEFHITANISGIDTGFAFLSYQDDTSGWKKDSVYANKQPLQFNGNISEAREAYFRFSNRKLGTLRFYIDKGEITITGKADSLSKADIKGIEGSETNVYVEMLNINKITSPLLDSLDTLYNRAEINSDKKAMKKYEDEYYKKQEELQQPHYYHFFYAHPKNIASLSFLESVMYGSLSSDSLKNMFSSLATEVQNSIYGKKVFGKIEEYAKTDIGKPAPIFTQKDTSGKEIDFAKVNKGKVLLLDFWASWCGPCRKENPNVVVAYEKYHAKGFEILGISCDDEKDKWIAAIKKDKLTWQHLSDLQGWKNEAVKLYAVRAIPSNFLIDANGIIIAKNLRGEALEKKLEELLK